jgi:transaldolase
MEIFIDTANVDEIKKYADIGIIDGVTTNPALITKEGRDFKEVLTEICKIVDGPISAEVISTTLNGMIDEARAISKLHEKIVVKLPAIPEGFKALNVISRERIKTNFTVVYSTNQALLAAKLGATYVSPFVGRLDVNSTSGPNLIKEIVKVFRNYNFETKVLAASMRNSIYVKEAALAGAHVATIPPEILDQMMENELSSIALEGFLDEWKKLPEEKRRYFK